jgi:hypothetical protein
VLGICKRSFFVWSLAGRACCQWRSFLFLLDWRQGPFFLSGQLLGPNFLERR